MLRVLIISLMSLFLCRPEGVASELVKLFGFNLGGLHYRALADARLKEHPEIWSRLENEARIDFTKELEEWHKTRPKRANTSKRRFATRSIKLEYERSFRNASFLSFSLLKYGSHYKPKGSALLGVETRSLEKDTDLLLPDLFREFEPGGETVAKLKELLKTELARQRRERDPLAPDNVNDDIYQRLIEEMPRKSWNFQIIRSERTAHAPGIMVFITPADTSIHGLIDHRSEDEAQGFMAVVPGLALLPYLKPEFVDTFEAAKLPGTDSP